MEPKAVSEIVVNYIKYESGTRHFGRSPLTEFSQWLEHAKAYLTDQSDLGVKPMLRMLQISVPDKVKQIALANFEKQPDNQVEQVASAFLASKCGVDEALHAVNTKQDLVEALGVSDSPEQDKGNEREGVVSPRMQ